MLLFNSYCATVVLSVFNAHVSHELMKSFFLPYLAQNDQNCCHQMDFWSSKYVRNASASGALPRTPLGELTALPQTS